MKFETRKNIKRDRDFYKNLSREVGREKNTLEEGLLYKDCTLNFISKVIKDYEGKVLYICDIFDNLKREDVVLIILEDYTHVEYSFENYYSSPSLGSHLGGNPYQGSYISKGSINVIAFTFDDVCKNRTGANNKILGAVSPIQKDPSSGSSSIVRSSKLYIEEFQVLERRNGIGTMMLKYLKQYVSEQNGRKNLYVTKLTGSLMPSDYDEIGDDMYKNLVSFYEKNDFKVKGRSIVYYFER